MERDFHTLRVPVAAGELIDKITILRIKRERLRRPEARANVSRELQALERVLTEAGAPLRTGDVQSKTTKLQIINTQLWDVEDSLRIMEADKRFDHEFITLARSVYQLNDQRAALKRQINEECGSSLVEEKSYGEQEHRNEKS